MPKSACSGALLSRQRIVQRVVVSTATKNLQDQLAEQDVPMTDALHEHVEQVLKTLRHLLRRFRALLRGHHFIAERTHAHFVDQAVVVGEGGRDVDARVLRAGRLCGGGGA